MSPETALITVLLLLCGAGALVLLAMACNIWYSLYREIKYWSKSG